MNEDNADISVRDDETIIAQIFNEAENSCDPCNFCGFFHPYPNEFCEHMNHSHPVFPQHPNAEIDSGLTKREYIAICAMQALIQCNQGSSNLPKVYAEKFAEVACVYADALLKRLDTND